MRLFTLFTNILLSLIVSGTHILAQAQTQNRHFNKITIIVLENTDYARAMKDPYLAELAASGASLTNMNGNTHPSQGNYIAMIAGDTYGVNHDNNVDLSGYTLVDLLETKGLSWQGYFDGYPGACFTGAQKGRYVRKHNPFMSFTNISRNEARCAKIRNSTEYFLDLKNNQLSNYNLFVPDLSNDGHDTGVTYASNWLKQNFSAKFKDPAFLNDHLIVITFDESATNSNNKIYTVLLGAQVRAGSKFTQAANHSSLLKLVENEFNLGTLNKGDKDSALIEGIWK